MAILKKLSKLLLCAAMPLFIAAAVMFSVGLLSGDKVWLKSEYEKLNINSYTGMSAEDMTAAFSRMVLFMKGRAPELNMTVTVNGEEKPMFGERENAHMQDVRKLYSGITTAKTVFSIFAVLAVALTLILFKRDGIRIAAKTYLFSFIGVLAVFLALGLFAALDFEKFWELFHVIFLDLESSTFDPAVSLMIRICPGELFFDMVMRIFALGMGVCGALAAASAVYLAIINKKKRRNDVFGEGANRA